MGEIVISIVILIVRLLIMMIGFIVIIFLMYYFYYDIIEYIKRGFKGEKKYVDNYKKILDKIYLDLNINGFIDDWETFKLLINRLEKENIGEYFYESYDLEQAVLLKYWKISYLTKSVLGELLVGQFFVSKDEKEIEELSKYIFQIFKDSKSEEEFLNKIYTTKKGKLIFDRYFKN